MTSTVVTRLPRRTTAQWAARNPILRDGEPGWDSTLKQLKVGDGVTAWLTLPWQTTNGAGGSGGVGVVDASSTAKGIVELATSAEAIAGTDTVRAVTPAGLAGGLATRQAASSVLAALAALAPTTYGQGFLTLADQAALMGLLSAATATTQGKVELATSAEAVAGTDTARAVTPAGAAAVIAAYDVLTQPALTNKLDAAKVRVWPTGSEPSLAGVPNGTLWVEYTP